MIRALGPSSSGSRSKDHGAHIYLIYFFISHYLKKNFVLRTRLNNSVQLIGSYISV